MYINQRVKAQFHQDQIADHQTQSQTSAEEKKYDHQYPKAILLLREYSIKLNTQNLREITRFDLKALKLPHDLSMMYRCTLRGFWYFTRALSIFYLQ